MSSPLSPVIANLPERLERIALASFNRDLPFYYRGWLMTVPSSKINKISDYFNSFYPRPISTLKVGGNSLNFLFFLLLPTQKQNYLTFDWYQKPTCSGRFLNFFFNHFSKERYCWHGEQSVITFRFKTS